MFLSSQGTFIANQRTYNVRYHQWLNPYISSNLRSKLIIACSVVGSTPGHPVIQQMVKSLVDNPESVEGRAHITVGPRFFTKTLKEHKAHHLDWHMGLYPFYYFVPVHHTQLDYNTTNPMRISQMYGSYTYHSWGTTRKSYKNATTTDETQKLANHMKRR